METIKEAMVIFQPSGRRGLVEKGISLIEASRRLGVDIETLCGEKKVCGKCRVRIEEGMFDKFGIVSGAAHASPWEQGEAKFISPSEREKGYRLACAARVQGDLLVYVPEESRGGVQVVSKFLRDLPVQWNPAVKLYRVQLPEPSFEDQIADWERVQRGLETDHGLKGLTIDHRALMRVPETLRKGRFQVTVAVWMDREVIGIVAGAPSDYYGLAVDVGTTTVAAYLCNLSDMKVEAAVSMMNPQCRYGEDVISRITYHQSHPDGLERMSADIIGALNTLLGRACDSFNRKNAPAGGHDEAGPALLTPEEVIDMTIVCNTVMHHILLRLNPEYVGSAPFAPVIHHSLDVKARDLGITLHESAYVHMLPNEAGFVGADNVAVLIAEEPQKGDQMQLIIDIGTNGELALGNRHKIVSASCATGPAFEGAQLTFGMRAAPGAIERVVIDPETHEADYKVIGNDLWRSSSDPERMKVKGICGSGVLDAVAEMFLAGIIARSGAFAAEQKSGRCRVNSETGIAEFVLAWKEETTIGRDVVITQGDIRQIQLAKGALYCGCKLLKKRLGIEEVDVVKIAGAFGSHIDPKKALIIGLFPDCDLSRIVSVGNAAGDGARLALLDRGKREEADRLARSVEYFELSTDPDFHIEFVEAMQIPHMTDAFPHLKTIVPDHILGETSEGLRG